jgi:hypothetical protein
MRAFLRCFRGLGAVGALVAPVLAASSGACGGDVTIGDQTPPDQDSGGSDGGARADAPAPGPDGSPRDARSTADGPAPEDACIDVILCTAGTHFDPQLCTCVPDDAGGTGDDAGGTGDDAAVDASRDGCIDIIVCPVGSVWDPQSCTCVPIDVGDSACTQGLGQMCGGIAGGTICCMPGLHCVLSGTFPDAPGTCQ